MKCSSVLKENEKLKKQAQLLFLLQESELDARTCGETPSCPPHLPPKPGSHIHQFSPFSPSSSLSEHAYPTAPPGTVGRQPCP